jgi:hypothetical protein
MSAFGTKQTFAVFPSGKFFSPKLGEGKEGRYYIDTGVGLFQTRCIPPTKLEDK